MSYLTVEEKMFSQDSVSEYLRLHRGGLTRSQLEYVSLADNVRVASGISRLEIEPATIKISVGGGLVTVRPSMPEGFGSQNSGKAGVRGEVVSFSAAARRRMMRLIASTEIDKRPIFSTLTLPDVFSSDMAKWKRDIDALGKRFRRKFPSGSLVWRIEFKERKSGGSVGLMAPHFHLLVWGVFLVEFRRWVAEAWYEVVGSGSRDHFMAGTSSERVRKWSGVNYYASKYVAKVGAFPDGWRGKSWGVIGRENLPVAEVVIVELADTVAIKLIRLGRKMTRLGGKDLRFGLTWIVRGERVLDYLEWYADEGGGLALPEQEKPQRL